LTIGARSPISDETIAPGPGKYEDVETGRAQTPAFSLPRSKRREIWQKPPEVPAPGEYEVLPVLPKPKRWAVRLRVPSGVNRKRTLLADQIRELMKATGRSV
jgi:hypothetical protein